MERCLDPIVSLHTNQSGLESQLEVLRKKPSVL